VNLSSIFVAIFGLAISLLGVGLLVSIFWSVKTGATLYGLPLRRLEYNQGRATFFLAVIGQLIFAAVLLYIGIGTLLLTFK
jgi:hypothetical protein